MTMERMLLKTIKFDLQVDHPYKFVLKVAKTFIGDRSKIEKVVQNCWGFINDRYEPSWSHIPAYCTACNYIQALI
mgnify:CR=1 FL=1